MKPTLPFFCCACIVVCGGCAAQEVNTTPPATEPSSNRFTFKEIRPGIFQFGTVTFDKARRSATWPISINMRTGVVEYAVVTTSGKMHESVFRTSAEPQDVHAAFLLMGAAPPQTNQFPSDLSQPLPGEPVELEVSWKDGERTVRQPMESFIITVNNGKVLSSGPWTYNGSHFSEGGFAAQQDGSIISVHIDPRALINNPRPGRENDDLHQINSSALPITDIPMEVTVRLLKEPARTRRWLPPPSRFQPGLFPAPPPSAGRP